MEKSRARKELRKARRKRGVGGVYPSVLAASTATPVIRLQRLEKAIDAHAQIYAKMEYVQPTGNHKTRIVNHLLGTLHTRKEIRPGQSTIIEPVDYPLGLAIATFCAVHGYRAILILPDDVAPHLLERLKLLGASVLTTPKDQGFDGADSKARALFGVLPDALMLQERTNDNAPVALANTIVDEILFDSQAALDMLVINADDRNLLIACKDRLEHDAPHIGLIAALGNAEKEAMEAVAAEAALATLGSFGDSCQTSPDAIEATIAHMAKEEGIILEHHSATAASVAIDWASRPESAEKRVLMVLTGLPTAD
ncbi:MAG: pyridoxal-phosphate dependent enzyme [Alphaproteobacteria bacterium]|nr:pyridoxal-phosphate dependent enzyme [Alphaproteobacteria bacterium]